MTAGKLTGFEKHRRRMKRKAVLNLLMVFLVAGAAGFYMAPFLIPVFELFGVSSSALASGMAIGAIWLLMWMLPVLHYREKTVSWFKGDKDEIRGISSDSPFVQMLLENGWELKEDSKKHVELKTYPSRIHQYLGLNSVIRMEVVEENEDAEISEVHMDGKLIETIESRVEEHEDGYRLTETGISQMRVSLGYLEPILFMMSQIMYMIEEANQDLEIQDTDVEIGFSKFESYDMRE